MVLRFRVPAGLPRLETVRAVQENKQQAEKISERLLQLALRLEALFNQTSQYVQKNTNTFEADVYFVRKTLKEKKELLDTVTDLNKKFSKLALKNNLTSAYPHSLIRSFPSQLSQEAQKEAQKNENPFLQLGESVKQTTAQMDQTIQALWERYLLPFCFKIVCNYADNNDRPFGSELDYEKLFNQKPLPNEEALSNIEKAVLAIFRKKLNKLPLTLEMYLY